MPDWSQGTARPHGTAIPVSSMSSSGPRSGHLFPHLALQYRGCTPARPRNGYATTRPRDGQKYDPRRRRLRLAMAEPDDKTRWDRWAGRPSWELPSDDADAYAGIHVWLGRDEYMATVAEVYDACIDQLRPFFQDHRGRGGPPGRIVVLAVTAVMAEVADHDTGRHSRASAKLIGQQTTYSDNTVTKVHRFLRLAGLATEVIRGRPRKLVERLACHKLGDKQRGWASEYALHPPRDTYLRALGVTLSDLHGVAHLQSGAVSFTSHLDTVVTTHHGKAVILNGRASRDRNASTKGASRPRKRAPADPGGRTLAAQLHAHPQTPAWLRQYTPTAWANALAPAAAAAWCAQDIHQLIRDYLGRHNPDTGRRNWIPEHPKRPITTLRAILNQHDDYTNRPAALDLEREAAEHAAQQVAQAAHLAELTATPRSPVPADHPARIAARQVAAAARRRSAERRRCGR